MRVVKRTAGACVPPSRMGCCVIGPPRGSRCSGNSSDSVGGGVALIGEARKVSGLGGAFIVSFEGVEPGGEGAIH